MANEIKLKRGSGSDPTASDLVVGELAIRTDNGKIFTKKDNGSVAEISGGGGIDDGDKGDITVSNSGDTFTIDNGVVTSAKIADGTIVNADINSSAAIAGTKISPDFGSQAIVTDGITLETSNNNDTFTGTSSNGIKIRSSSISLQQPSSPNNFYAVFNNNGCDLRVANAQKLVVNSSGTAITGNLDVSSGVDVTGNITVSGTVDGRDVATDGTKLDGIESNATADQTASEIVALIADQTIAPSAIDMEDDEEIRLGNSDDLKIFHNGSHSRFLDNGAGKLQFGSDTGFEILTANFATQIALFDTTQILLKENTSVTGNISVSGTVDGRDIASDGSKLDGIAAGATNVTNNNQLTNGAGYITATLTNEQVQDIVGGMVSGNTESGITVTYQDSDGTLDFSVASQTDNNFTNADHSKLDGIEAGATADQTASEILTLLKTVDGAGSGLDADTLDGVSSGSFLRSDTGDSASGDIAFQGGAGAVTISANSDIRLENGNWTGDALGKIQHHSNYLYIGGGSSGIIFRESGTNRWIIDGSGHLAVGADSTYDIGTSGTRVRNGYFDTLYGDGSNLTGISAGATGGGSDEIFYENGQTVTTNYTITNGKNAMSAGPITVNSGVTVTVGAGETLTIV